MAIVGPRYQHSTYGLFDLYCAPPVLSELPTAMHAVRSSNRQNQFLQILIFRNLTRAFR